MDINATSQQITSHALRILQAEGAQAVTMRRIAKEIGITPMAIYYHFTNRDALLHEVVDTEFERLADAFTEPSTDLPVPERFIRLMDGYMSYALANPRVFDYVFSLPRPNARRFPDDFRARLSPTLNIVADNVEQWMDQKKLKPDDVWEIAMEIWAVAHGYLMLYRAGRFHLSEDEFQNLVRRALRRLFDGLSA